MTSDFSFNQLRALREHAESSCSKGSSFKPQSFYSSSTLDQPLKPEKLFQTTFSNLAESPFPLPEEEGKERNYQILKNHLLDHYPSLIKKRPQLITFKSIALFQNAGHPLHFAVKARDFDLLKAIVKAGADINQTDSEGDTVLAMIMKWHPDPTRDPIGALKRIQSSNESTLKFLSDASDLA